MFVAEIEIRKLSVHFYERCNVQFDQEELLLCLLTFPYSFHKVVSKAYHLSQHYNLYQKVLVEASIRREVEEELTYEFQLLQTREQDMRSLTSKRQKIFNSKSLGMRE